MPLPDLSRLSEPTAAPLQPLRKGQQQVLTRVDEDHANAMAVHAFHNGWPQLINYGGLTTSDYLSPVAWAKWHCAIFGFFVPMDTLNAALGHTGHRDPRNTMKPLYTENSPLFQYARDHQDDFWSGYINVPRMREAYMHIMLNPSNARMYTEGDELRNPSCELELLITDRALVDTNPGKYIWGENNYGPDPNDLQPAVAHEMVVQVLVTAASDPDSVARQAWNQALDAIGTRLRGLALVDRSRLGHFVQAVRSRLQSRTVLWYAFNLAGLTLPAGPADETMPQFLRRMWELMSTDMARTFVKATENRIATMGYLNARQAPSFGLRHQICMSVEPDVPVIVVRKFLPTPEFPYDPQVWHPSQRPPLKPWSDAEENEEVGWMCGADDKEVIIAPGATYTLVQNGLNDPYRIVNELDRVNDEMSRLGLYGEANTRADEEGAVRWFVHVTRPA